jgi:small subunit ribosomal protein S18
MTTGHPPGGSTSPRPPGGKRGRRQYMRRRKVCRFCVERVDYIDYKNAEILRSFVQERGKIVPRRLSGTCSRHQRWLRRAIKRARNIALLPFAAEP